MFIDNLGIDQIMWCIAHYKGSQAVVEKVHWIEKIPFAEE